MNVKDINGMPNAVIINDMPGLLRIATGPIIRTIRNRFWKMVEQHYSIAAEVEDWQAADHAANAAYYRAMMLTARNNLTKE